MLSSFQHRTSWYFHLVQDQSRSGHPGLPRKDKQTRSLAQRLDCTTITTIQCIFGSLHCRLDLPIMFSTNSVLVPFDLVPDSRVATYAAICLLLAAVCFATRIVTGRRSNLKTEDASEPKDVEVVPYFVPWLGSAISFGLRFQDFLAESQYVSKTSRRRSVG